MVAGSISIKPPSKKIKQFTKSELISKYGLQMRAPAFYIKNTTLAYKYNE
jgi:hypothetical protein